MSLAVRIDDRTSPWLLKLKERLQDAHEEIGVDVTQLVKDHLYRMDAERPNKLGGKRTHFYGTAADATHFKTDPQGVTVTISQLGLRQRINGGVITATNAKLLTIPISARAHGKRAREFAELELVVLGNVGRKRDQLFLAELDGEGKIEELLYVLKRSVKQEGDRALLPADQEITTTATQALTDFFNRLR